MPLATVKEVLIYHNLHRTLRQNKGRFICFYDYESDLSDGWEDEEVHNDNYEIREKALKMGANIIEYAFKN